MERQFEERAGTAATSLEQVVERQFEERAGRMHSGKQNSKPHNSVDRGQLAPEAPTVASC